MAQLGLGLLRVAVCASETPGFVVGFMVTVVLLVAVLALSAWWARR